MRKVIWLLLVCLLLVACGSKDSGEEPVSYYGENGVFSVTFTKYGSYEDMLEALPEDFVIDQAGRNPEDYEVYLFGEFILSYSKPWTGASMAEEPTVFRFITKVGQEAVTVSQPEEGITDDTLRVHIPLVAYALDDGNGNHFGKLVFTSEGQETIIHLEELADKEN